MAQYVEERTLSLWFERRDPKAFQDIVSQYTGVVYGAARRIVGNSKDAEELAQECFESFLKLKRAPRTPLGPWFHRVAANRALNRLRTDTRRRKREDTYARAAAVSSEPSWDDIYGFIDEALAALPDDSRVALVAHYLEGKSQTDMARGLGVTRQAVGYRINKGLKELRARLRKRGVTMTSAALGALLLANVSEAAPARVVAAAGKLAMALACGVTVPQVSMWSALSGALAAKGAVAAIICLGLVLGALGLVAGGHPAAQDAPSTAADASGPEPPAGSTPEPSQPDAADEALIMAKNAAPAAGSISGRVYYEGTDIPVAGAELHIDTETGGQKPRRGLVAVVTDEDGRYHMEDLEPGRYSFRRYMLNGLPGGDLGKEVELRAGESVLLDLPVFRGVAIAGRVVDEDGEPLGGVHVQALTNQENQWRDGESDTEGFFEVVGFERPGRGFTVQARKKGYALPPLADLIVPEEGLSGLTLTMAPEALIAGMVVDGTNQPLADVGVTVRNIQTDSSDNPSTRTAEDGSFSLGRLYAGQFRVIVTAPGSRSYSPDNQAAVVDLKQGERIDGLVLVYEPGKGLKITGTVIDSGGNPLESVFLRVEGVVSQGAFTDEHGRYRFTGLPEGAYRVRVSEGDRAATIDNVAGGSEGVDFILDEFAQLAGTVVDANTGAAVTDFEIANATSIRESIDWETMWRYQRVEDEAGRFELKKVVPGAATIFVRAPGYAEHLHPVGGIAPGERIANVEVKLQRGEAIAGTVRNAQADRLEGARIYLGTLPGQQYLSHAAATVTDADGAFTVNVRPAASQTLTIYHTAYAPKTLAVPLIERREDSLDITLTGGGAVVGRLNLDGVPMAERTAALFVGETHCGIARTGSDGTYGFEHVMPGAVEVVGYLPATEGTREWRRITRQAVVKEAETTDVKFQAFSGDAAIEGLVLLDGQPLTDGAIDVAVPTEAGIVRVRCVLTLDGAYAIQGLPAGQGGVEVTLCDENGQQETWTQDVLLREGQTIRHDLDLTR